MPSGKCVAASEHAKSVDMSGSFVPSKRNLLGTARVAQGLDGNRLTGSLLSPQEDYILPPNPSQARAEPMSALGQKRTSEDV